VLGIKGAPYKYSVCLARLNIRERRKLENVRALRVLYLESLSSDLGCSGTSEVHPNSRPDDVQELGALTMEVKVTTSTDERSTEDLRVQSCPEVSFLLA